MGTVTPEARVLTAVAYLLWPVSLILVLTRLRRDRFIRYHGYQSLFLGIVCFVVYLVVGSFLRVIPVFGEVILRITVLGWIVFVVFLAIRSLQGEYFKVPLIYDLAAGVME
jgi:uncharacterized membrane protein